jgi:hypothetical protein
MRFDQIEGYEPAPPEPPPGRWGYDGTQPVDEQLGDAESFDMINHPPTPSEA